MEQRLCLLFTPDLCSGDPWRTLRAALLGGVDLVQWRVKRPDSQAAQECLRICDAAGVRMIVNDDIELARSIDAFGAHVGQDDTPGALARATLGPTRVLGISTHDDQQIDAAIADGADYIGFGPAFPTATKGYDEGQPIASIARAVARASVPVFAIGGITPDNVGTILDAGVRHIAVSATILQADDPGVTATKLREQLSE